MSLRHILYSSLCLFYDDDDLSLVYVPRIVKIFSRGVFFHRCAINVEFQEDSFAFHSKEALIFSIRLSSRRNKH